MTLRPNQYQPFQISWQGWIIIKAGLITIPTRHRGQCTAPRRLAGKQLFLALLWLLVFLVFPTLALVSHVLHPPSDRFRFIDRDTSHNALFSLPVTSD